VQRDVVLVLHREPDVEGARTLSDGLQLGGEPDRILELLRGPRGKYVRVFSGYSGWGAGQLRDELESGSWIVTPAVARVIFETKSDAIWETVLRSLGPRYAYLTGLPLDPRVN
jgi:putative transcriptional regulator